MARLIPPVPYRLTIGPSDRDTAPESPRRDPLRLTGHVPLKVDDRNLPPRP